MSEVKLYVRTDLRTNSGKKVPNGKMAAQSAHALMAGFLSLFKREEDCLVSTPENLALIKSFLSGELTLSIKPIKESAVESILERNAIPIVDQGRTVFKEPTLTTIIEMPKSAILNRYAVDCAAEQNERYRSKQTLVIDKSQIKDKWEMFELVSNASMKGIYNFAMEMENEVVIPLKNEGFAAWINGAFAKITLQPKEATMIGLLESLNSQSEMNYSLMSKGSELACISIGPHHIEKVDKFTKNGFSLV